MKNTKISRRRFLRGLCQGAGVGVGLPMLDLFLNNNGNAFASGKPLPVCFGTWNWTLGLYGDWTPKQTGTNYQLPLQLRSLAPIKDKINLVTGLDVFLDGPTVVHTTGPQCIMTGSAKHNDHYGASLDYLIGKKLGVQPRFPSMTVSVSGEALNSWASDGGSGKVSAEISPLALYQRIFGDGFIPPDGKSFTPDPAITLRHSMLSYVKEERQQLMRYAGAKDRLRLDAFFTSLRDLENKLAFELDKPEPILSCSPPQESPLWRGPSSAIDDVLNTHSLFSQLIAHALSCGQTQVFNIGMSLNHIIPGDPATSHTYSHEEQDDPKLSYPPKSFWFVTQLMEAFREIVTTLDTIKEGDGTLLDRTLLMGYTDHGDARVHSLKNIPFITAGSAGGKVKTGLHISQSGSSCNRMGLTCMQVMGLPVSHWGEGPNKVNQPLSEMLV